MHTGKVDRQTCVCTCYRVEFRCILTVEHALRCPLTGGALTVDRLVQQRIQGVAVPVQPAVKALESTGGQQSNAMRMYL